MIENVNSMISEFKASPFGKATRKSAQVIWKANLDAFATTRDELGKVVGLFLKEGEKLTRRSRARTEEVVGGLSDVANERVSEVEKRFQAGVNRVIHDIGLPTAAEVDKLSRKVERLSKKVETGAPAKRGAPRNKAAAKRAPRKKAAARRAPRKQAA